MKTRIGDLGLLREALTVLGAIEPAKVLSLFLCHLAHVLLYKLRRPPGSWKKHQHGEALLTFIIIGLNL